METPKKRRGPGRQFTKGNPGRPKGSPNKATVEIRELARKLLDDPEYQESLRQRLIAGEAAHMETLLHHYAFGKPTEKMELTGVDGASLFGSLKVEVIQSRAGSTN